MTCYASVAQLVEHNLAKVGVARSNRVTRSILCPIKECINNSSVNFH